MNQKALISIVGVPEDGCLSLTSRAVSVVSGARLLAGDPRHLKWFPQFHGTFIDMSVLGVSQMVARLIDESEEGNVVVLASGDPLYFGIGTLFTRNMPREELAFYPSLTSPQLAFSKLALPWQKAQTLSLHGRPLSALVSRLQSGDLFALLTDGINTPQKIAQHLLSYNEKVWEVYVCEALSGADEKISTWNLEELAQTQYEFHPLNLIVLQRHLKEYWGGYGQYAQDDAFSKRVLNKGLITKAPIRHLTLAMLKINAESCVWDIGSGSGSVAVEAAKQAYSGRVFAIESNDQCYVDIEYNAHEQGTDNLVLVKGSAPRVLEKLPAPDAVFIGGSRGQMPAILDAVFAVLKDEGNIVCSAITLETVQDIFSWCKNTHVEANYQLVNISESKKISHYHALNAYNPIYLFHLKKS